MQSRWNYRDSQYILSCVYTRSTTKKEDLYFPFYFRFRFRVIYSSSVTRYTYIWLYSSPSPSPFSYSLCSSRYSMVSSWTALLLLGLLVVTTQMSRHGVAHYMQDSDAGLAAIKIKFDNQRIRARFFSLLVISQFSQQNVSHPQRQQMVTRSMGDAVLCFTTDYQ